MIILMILIIIVTGTRVFITCCSSRIFDHFDYDIIFDGIFDYFDYDIIFDRIFDYFDYDCDWYDCGMIVTGTRAFITCCFSRI